ncbi:hypothetical protein [Bacillus mycoides]|uniref:Uncharacterized protein n=1 Tax=Bacillus mycoides TaxID=1405 RepID=A0ABC9QV64_BACMY|nr:hypothetical protein [Bacillus mycoides]EJR29944.1 hypothetical protein III_05713 [Bacillus mycoides]
MRCSQQFLLLADVQKHIGNKWDELRFGPIQQKTPVMIERQGKSRPGEPLKKDQKVFLKFTNSSHSGYQYLNIGNGYN